MMRHTWLIAWLMIAALWMVGCESKPTYQYAHIDANLTLKDAQERAVSQRALEYWEAFSSKDFNTTYPYELPFQRYLHDLEWYLVFNKGNEKGYETIQTKIVHVDEHRVILKTLFKSSKAKFMMSDRWYLVDGVWYHKMNTSKLPTLEKW